MPVLRSEADDDCMEYPRTLRGGLDALKILAVSPEYSLFYMAANAIFFFFGIVSNIA